MQSIEYGNGAWPLRMVDYLIERGIGVVLSTAGYKLGTRIFLLRTCLVTQDKNVHLTALI